MGLFSLVLVFLGTQDFYDFDFKAPGVDFKNIEASKINVYELNSTLAKANYRASAWERYADKDIFSAVLVYGYDFNISSNALTFADGNISLQGKVRYADNNQTRFESESLFYDKKKRNLSARVDFKAYRKNDLLTGTAFDYDLEGKRLRIRGVKAWLD